MTKRSDIIQYGVTILPKNVVDKDVQSMLLPLNLMQNIMFCPKYRIKNNVIGPVGFIHNTVSFIGTALFINAFLYRLFLLYFDRPRIKPDTDIQFAISLFDCCFYAVVLAMNFISGIIQTKMYISFVLIFQKVHRFLNDKQRHIIFTFWNWFSVSMAGGFFAVISIATTLCLGLPYFYMLSFYSIVSVDFNYVYAIRHLKLLEDKIILWSVRALNSHGIEEEDRKQMFEAYVNILQCYEIYKVCYQKTIFYYTLEVFINSLAYFQVVLEMIKLGMKQNDLKIAVITSLTVICWSMKNLTMQLILCQYCEKFYLAVEKAQDCCAIILNSNCTDDEKRLVKNIQRLHRATFRRIRVYGLFDVDAALLLNLMSLLTNYIVVLLAYAFL